MKKNNPRIKYDLKLNRQDEINVINMIANMFFKDVKDDDGVVIGTQYTPYLEKTAKVNAIVRYFLDGIEVEDGEDVYDEAMNDDEIYPLVNSFFKDDCLYFRDLDDIMKKVYDIVEYRKKEQIARIQNEANSILTYKLLELIELEQEKNKKEIDAVNNLNAWIGEQRELNSLITPEMQRDFAQNFDVNTLTEAIYNKMSESDLHKRNREVIKLAHENRKKDNKIIEMQNEFAKEKQKENVKNVLSD